MNNFEELLKMCTSRIKLKTAYDKGLIDEHDYALMYKGICPETVEDFNEFSAIVQRNGKFYHVDLDGHDWKRIGNGR
jgi:hypothetical protein